MNEAVNIIFGNSFGYPFCAFDMDVFKIEIPKNYQYGPLQLSKYATLGRVVPSNKIVNDVRMSNAFFDGRCISKIVFLEKCSAARDRKMIPEDLP